MFEVKLKTFFKDGREVDTVASAEHFIDFEEHYDMPFATAFSSGKVTYLYYLSWLTAGSDFGFKEWAKTIRDVDPVTEAATPFEESPSEGSSPS